jgi:hypothetical protein
MKECEKGIVEWCQNCDNETQLENEFKVQICEHCGRPIIPCTICPQNYENCSQCPLKAEYEKTIELYNKKMGEGVI